MSDVKLRIIGECVIEVGDRQLGPETSHLFALLLVLGCATGRPLLRSELCELLFPALARKRASHNLRQLLYRLRAMGAPIVSLGEGVELRGVASRDAVSAFGKMSKSARLRLQMRTVSVLPRYAPAISTQLEEWVDGTRSSLEARLRTILVEDFQVWRSECNWDAVITTGHRVQQLDAANAEVVSGLAEALLMTGHKTDALEVVDEFLSYGAAGTSPEHVDMRRLRARIAKTGSSARVAQGRLRGRLSTLRSLSRQWALALDGAAQFSLILASPGIGKSRLAADFTDYVLLHGGDVLSHNCESSDKNRPHSLFASLLPRLRTMRGSIGANPALQPYLTLLTSHKAPAAPLEPASLESIRYELQLALCDLVEAVSMEKPLLLVVDDADALDAASWGVLRALCDQRRSNALMAICCCRRMDGEQLPTHPAQSEVHYLEPLDADNSADLLAELLIGHMPSAGYFDSMLVQASGNPYYLHALAHHALDNRHAGAVPADIQTLASASYHSLDVEARTLLEASLYLGRFSTLQRIQDITALDGRSLIEALRRLEEFGLLHFTAGELHCSHSLLEEALKSIVPSSVAALHRIKSAQCLEKESALSGYPASLAWAAVDNFVAAGDFVSALRLVGRCASLAASVGEAQTAARILLPVAQANLPLRDRADVYDAIITFADAAGDRELAYSSLHERLTLGRALGDSTRSLQDLELRMLEAIVQQGTRSTEAIEPLSTILADQMADAHTRARAGLRLLIIADMLLDEELAHSTHDQLEQITADTPLGSLYNRAQLVWETVFGNQERAFAIVTQLLRDNPEPSLSQAVIGARHYAAFALSRMGRRELAKPILLTDYQFMVRHHVASEALYVLTLLAENAIADGNGVEAARFLQDASAALDRGEPRTQFTEQSFRLATASLALMEGRLSDAEEAIGIARRHSASTEMPRAHLLVSALELRIRCALGNALPDDPQVVALREQFDRCAHLGAHDDVVAALWEAYQNDSQFSRAKDLLRRYVSIRRERTPLDPSLRRAK